MCKLHEKFTNMDQGYQNHRPRCEPPTVAIGEPRSEGEMNTVNGRLLRRNQRGQKCRPRPVLVRPSAASTVLQTTKQSNPKPNVNQNNINEMRYHPRRIVNILCVRYPRHVRTNTLQLPPGSRRYRARTKHNTKGDWLAVIYTAGIQYEAIGVAGLKWFCTSGGTGLPLAQWEARPHTSLNCYHPQPGCLVHIVVFMFYFEIGSPR